MKPVHFTEGASCPWSAGLVVRLLLAGATAESCGTVRPIPRKEIHGAMKRTLIARWNFFTRQPGDIYRDIARDVYVMVDGTKTARLVSGQVLMRFGPAVFELAPFEPYDWAAAKGRLHRVHRVKLNRDNPQPKP